jgi:CubicO group peptidase (beta-lactamase class C family)
VILSPEPFFDLASLTKPIVTAPLAIRHLDLDADRRLELNLQDWPVPLTVRQMLSHSSGMPPWLPFTGEPLATQLKRGFPVGSHPLFRTSHPGTSLYSDLNYRIIAELLEKQCGLTFSELGATSSGLTPAPYPVSPVEIPDGQDAAAWSLYDSDMSLPPRTSNLPHDANARAGMRGHAGFGASPTQMKMALETWVSQGWPSLMAVETARGEDGTRWGLGLQRLPYGIGRFGQLLSGVGSDIGVHILVDTEFDLAEPSPTQEGESEFDSPFWFHLGYTGPALFIRPETGLCICLLVHRRGPGGELLDPDQLRDRRWKALSRLIS